MDSADANGYVSQAYLRNAWYPVDWVDSLGPTPVAKMLLEEEIVLYRKADGTALAASNRCPHRFAELHNGKVIGDNLQCPYHGLQYSPTGACAHNPHGKNLPKAARIKSYPLLERHDLIWIWMGASEKADPTLIPDLRVITDKGHRTVRGVLKLAADYQLYSDNLLDLSHSEFVHPVLLEQGSLDRSTVKVVQNGGTVNFIRDSGQERATGTFQRMLCEGMGGKAGDLVTTRHHIRWDAPACLYGEITQFRGNQKTVLTSIHLATPTRRGHTDLIWAAVREFGLNDANLDEKFYKGMTHILVNEDFPPMESQQTYVRCRDLLAIKPVLLSVDEAPVRARRVLAELIRNEVAGHAAQSVASLGAAEYVPSS